MLEACTPAELVARKKKERKKKKKKKKKKKGQTTACLRNCRIIILLGTGPTTSVANSYRGIEGGNGKREKKEEEEEEEEEEKEEITRVGGDFSRLPFSNRCPKGNEKRI